jgi:hypothetical protein
MILDRTAGLTLSNLVLRPTSKISGGRQAVRWIVWLAIIEIIADYLRDEVHCSQVVD